jgi:hypothetical protein
MRTSCASGALWGRPSPGMEIHRGTTRHAARGTAQHALRHLVAWRSRNLPNCPKTPLITVVDLLSSTCNARSERAICTVDRTILANVSRIILNSAFLEYFVIREMILRLVLINLVRAALQSRNTCK